MSYTFREYVETMWERIEGKEGKSGEHEVKIAKEEGLFKEEGVATILNAE
jgi:hypothetical protein